MKYEIFFSMSNFNTKAIFVNNLNQNGLIVKSNNLIEASYRLTTQEQKIILLVSSMIKMNDIDFKEYYIDVQLFMKAIGVTGHSKYEELKEITRKLRKRDLIIKNLEDETETQVGWVSSFKYFDKKGYVQIRFDPELKPYFLNLKERFTQYQRKYVLRLKSSYSIRIYELLKQFEKIKERYFELKELREILGIFDDKYKLYGDFKRKVLKRAEKELPQKTDLKFLFKEKKQRNKVVGIYFFIKPNTTLKEDEEGIDIESLNMELYLKLQNFFCLSVKQARQALNTKPEEELLENLAYVEREQKLGAVKNIGAYTWKVIQENIKIQYSLFENEKEEKRQAEQQKVEIEKLEHLFTEDKKQKIEKIIQGLTDTEEAKIKKDFDEYMKTKSSLERKRYQEKGFEGVQLYYRSFISQQFLDPVDNDFILWVEKYHNQKIQKNSQGEFEFI